MAKVRFGLPRVTVGGSTDCAYLFEDEDPLASLVGSVVQDIATEVMVTVSGVTMHLAAWQDPDHWADDWREAAGDEDVAEFIAGLLAAATES